MAADEPLITDEELDRLRDQVTDFYHGLDSTARMRDFARRIEALTRKRLAERLPWHDKRDEDGKAGDSRAASGTVPAAVQTTVSDGPPPSDPRDVYQGQRHSGNVTGDGGGKQDEVGKAGGGRDGRNPIGDGNAPLSGGPNRQPSEPRDALREQIEREMYYAAVADEDGPMFAPVELRTAVKVAERLVLEYEGMGDAVDVYRERAEAAEKERDDLLESLSQTSHGRVFRELRAERDEARRALHANGALWCRLYDILTGQQLQPEDFTDARDRDLLEAARAAMMALAEYREKWGHFAACACHAFCQGALPPHRHPYRDPRCAPEPGRKA